MMNLRPLGFFIAFSFVAGSSLSCKERAHRDFRKPAATEDGNDAVGNNPEEPGQEPQDQSGENDQTADNSAPGPAPAPAPSETPDTSPVEAPAKFRVVGYHPTWAGGTAGIQFDKLTHINYSFMIPTEDGGYKPVDNPNLLKDIVARAHSATPRVNVLIAIGGWGSGATREPMLRAFRNIVSNEATGNTFITKLLAFVDQYQLDGVDIDWEYPTAAEGVHFAKFAGKLKEKLKAKGKLLTVAVAAHGNSGSGILKESFAHFDFFNVMSYDDESAGHHASMEFVNKAMTYWVTTRGVDKKKINMGVPFYGRPTPTATKFKFSVAYKNVPAVNRNDPVKNLTWTANGNMDYDGRNRIKEKTAWALKEYGGIMIWELSQDAADATSLLTAIHEKINATPAPIVP